MARHNPNLVPVGVNYLTEVQRCAQLTIPQLREELARGLTLTAEHLLRLAAVWQELENRGEDLSDLRQGIARTLPLIASGRLAAETVVTFSHRPLVLRALEGVPLERQRSLCAGEPIEVIDPGSGGTSLIPLGQLPQAAVRLVFAEGEIRTPSAQRLALRPRRPKRQDVNDSYHYHPRVDREAGVVHVGKMQVRLDELLQALSASAGPELPAITRPEEYVTIRVRLTPEEQSKLVRLAQQAELPDWELVRKALRAMGLI